MHPDAPAAEEAVLQRLLDNEIPPGPTTPYGFGPDELTETFGPVGNRPVVFLHGGYWRPAIDRSHARPLAAALARRGCWVLLAEYPRVPGDPAATTAALTRLAAATPDEAAWVGHSAGGHLVLWLAVTGVIDRAIGLAAVSDLEAARAQRLGDDAVSAYFGSGPLDAWDPRHLICQASAPALTLLHGTADATVPIEQSRSFPAPLAELDGAHHFDLIDPASGHFERLPELLAVS